MILLRIAIAVALFYFLARIGLAGSNLGLIIGHNLIAFLYAGDYDNREPQCLRPRAQRGRLDLGRQPLAHDDAGDPADDPRWHRRGGIFVFMTSLSHPNIALFVAGGEQHDLAQADVEHHGAPGDARAGGRRR